jgi:hypothetical protein
MSTILKFLKNISVHIFLELSNGNYAAQPNNRILWNIPSYTTEINKPDYKVQTTYWNVENKDWKTDDTNDMFYDIKE